MQGQMPALSPVEGKVVALAGGVGGGKLARGLAAVLPADELTLVVNTADDFEHLGRTSHRRRHCDIRPGGHRNPDTGWGSATPSRRWRQSSLGGPAWFRFSTETSRLTWSARAGWRRARLTGATAAISRALGAGPVVLLMSDDPVRTKVDTTRGGSTQDYFVRRHEFAYGFEFALAARPSREVVRH
jgi:LPPG:FO 2-phospho-L-lactate transferase